MKPQQVRGVAFLIGGLAALWAAVSVTQFRFVAIAVGVVCFLLAATALSQAGQIAASLRPFRDRSVRVRVWGAPIPTTGDPTLEIDSVMAVSAGLLIHLRPGRHGARTLLKVAQPGPARIGDGQFEIDSARYVSWGGRKLTPAAGHPALTLLVAP